jgi:hypothetical protein
MTATKTPFSGLIEPIAFSARYPAGKGWNRAGFPGPDRRREGHYRHGGAFRPKHQFGKIPASQAIFWIEPELNCRDVNGMAALGDRYRNGGDAQRLRPAKRG